MGYFRQAAVAGVGVTIAAVVAHGALAFHPVGPAPDTPGGQAAAQRHANFGRFGKASKTIDEELKKDAPDKAAIAAAAATMNELAPQLPSWFPKGSGKEAWSETRAKAEVWSDAEGFAAAADRLRVETEKMQLAAAAGDLAVVRVQDKAMGATCKSCHEKYREEAK